MSFALSQDQATGERDAAKEPQVKDFRQGRWNTERWQARTRSADHCHGCEIAERAAWVHVSQCKTHNRPPKEKEAEEQGEPTCEKRKDFLK